MEQDTHRLKCESFNRLKCKSFSRAQVGTGVKFACNSTCPSFTFFLAFSLLETSSLSTDWARGGEAHRAEAAVRHQGRSK